MARLYLQFPKTFFMEKSKFGTNQEAHLDPMYHNGQSDAEKLMHRHLQSGDELTDKDLEGLKITKADGATETTTAVTTEKDEDSGSGESNGSDRIVTPLDVLGG